MRGSARCEINSSWEIFHAHNLEIDEPLLVDGNKNFLGLFQTGLLSLSSIKPPNFGTKIVEGGL
jgi:hypothetical protein